MKTIKKKNPGLDLSDENPGFDLSDENPRFDVQKYPNGVRLDNKKVPLYTRSLDQI